MLVFIGTLHLGFTPEDELIKIIESFNPSSLLIEIAQEDIDSGDIYGYPTEMQAALSWAATNNVKVNGFDSKIQALKEEATNEDFENLDHEQRIIIEKYDWKEFNQSHLENILKTPSWYKVIDENKDREREQAMYRNITRLADDSHITVIITGSGHIPYFKHKFTGALFPLSNSKGSRLAG